MSVKAGGKKKLLLAPMWRVRPLVGRPHAAPHGGRTGGPAAAAQRAHHRGKRRGPAVAMTLCHAAIIESCPELMQLIQLDAASEQNNLHVALILNFPGLQKECEKLSNELRFSRTWNGVNHWHNSTPPPFFASKYQLSVTFNKKWDSDFFHSIFKCANFCSGND